MTDGSTRYEVSGGARTLARRAHVQEAGAGPTLLCLHGIGSSSDSFAAQLTGLSGHFRVVARDAPGYARSPDPDAAPGLDAYADEAAALIQERGSDGAFVLGMSWGGVIATRLASRHPHLVRALVLGDSTRGSGRTTATAQAMLARKDELADQGPERFARSRAPRLVAPSTTPEVLDQVVSAMAEAIRLPGYGYAARSMAETDLEPELPGVTVPTLVLYGSVDTVTGRPESEAIAAQLGGDVELAAINGAGHLANQEQPQAFNREVLRFLTPLR